MAKLKKPFVTAPASEPDEEEQPAPAEEQAEVFSDDSVQKIFAALSDLNLSGGKVGIHLKRPNSLKATYEGYMTIEQFKEDGLETLKNTYGGGDYTLRFHDSNGRVVTSSTVSIDPRFKGSVDASPAAAPAEKPDDERLATAIEKIRPPQPQENMMPLLITLITESNKTIAGMMSANQLATNTILTGLMQAITSAQTKPGTDPVLLELIRQKTDKTPISETIEAFATLRDLTAEGGEGKPKEDMIEKFVKLVGPSLVAFFARQAGPQMMPQPQLQQVPEQAQAQEAPPAPEVAPEPKLTQYIPLLLNAARKKTAVESYYDFICDNLTQEQIDALCDELEKPGWFETLFGTHAEVVAQKEWFEKLRGAFLYDSIAADEKPEGKEVQQEAQK